MPFRRVLLAAVSIATVMLGAYTNAADQTLIAPGASWRYNDSGANLGTAWRAAGYNDAAWPSGIAQLGYGDGDEATVLSWGSNSSNRRITYYFRRSFTVANPAAFSALAVRYVRDDGLVIYLNGVEIVRSNMPSGTVTYTTRATTAISGTAESAWIESLVDRTLLVAGNNVIAVELHQQSATSTDISFNLELRATEAAAPVPTVSLVSPADNGVVNNPAVTFTAQVTAPAGLESATLFLGGPPQTTVFTGPAQIEDATISADAPTLADGGGAAINVDGQTPHGHGLMRFPTLVGSGAGQVPAGAIVTSATLQLNCTNAGNTMALYRLTQSWVEDQATWNQRSTGISWGAPGAEGTGSHADAAVNGDCTVTGQRLVNITSFVQDWTNGQANYGVVFIDSGTDGVVFGSSESATSPVLTVVYKSTQAPAGTQSVSGTSASVSFPTSLSLGQTYFWNVRVTDVNQQQSWAPADYQLIVDANSPNAPVLVSPADDATGVGTSPSLRAQVSDPLGGSLNVTFETRQAVGPEFTIIALPDTQHYSEAFPAVFTAQTQWIVDKRVERNIVFVTHEGDIVEHESNTTEWDRARASMDLLHGVVPYGMGPGNHDQPTTRYNLYFGWERFAGFSWYGGHMGSLNDNNYQLFSASGLDFVIVHLTYCPPAAAVTWADSVFKQFPNRIGIMTTHAYLDESAQRSPHGCTNTQYLWDGVAVPNPNLHFMLSGHVHDESRRADVLYGHPVHQMLADYQDRASGGEGWLRILRFVPAEDKVYVQTYSPWLNRFETDANSEFVLDFDMGGAWSVAGTTTTQSGQEASITPNLDSNTSYEWRVTATNASGKSRTGAVWSFTTGAGGPVNQAPTANGQSVNATEDVTVPITLSGSDPEGSPLTYSIVGAPSKGTLTGSMPTLSYQPTPHSNGADSFTFRVSDGQATSALATVSIAVQAVNDPPTAGNNAYNAQSGVALSVAAPGVLANDADVENSALSAQLVSPPANGALTLNANGSFSYTATAGYTGPDAFSYEVSDGAALSGVATVSLTVLPGDITPPLRSNGQPSGTLPAGTTQATLSLTTNEAATCRYATSAGVAYLSMPSTFSTTGALSHSTLVTGLGNGGSYSFFVRCRDAATNANTDDVSIAFAVATPPPPSPVGLVAAYSFNEVSGTTLVDRTGAGHTGTVSGATWTTQGRFGGALSFDGVNDWVTIASQTTLALTTGMTLEGWVYPQSLSNWRTILLKEQPGGLSYGLFSDATSHAAGWATIGTQVGVASPATLPLNTWTHIAVTYDGAVMRLFVNGSQVATRSQSGAMATSSDPLRIGGTSLASAFFQGRIDEVRIYNRALTPAEVSADVGVGVTP
jgi:hypothetical protein